MTIKLKDKFNFFYSINNFRNFYIIQPNKLFF